ncbi:MAG: Ribosomal RNA small subunit methyltransferase A [Candidatus Giovannonibacteria bacterium GW2011_GWC2_44_9]|uniref:Ribosomal RNA small subunit methyltransferase A n=2 Tax=Candidatus Giovannoniibacteriota TaxID=1752738 RepID=A0A0G1L4K5_9BACT|nr:MAG: Ribosomal RNA small subunit methyltransferase A [Candidatus Giovannonibacteria bacterium GW2011_GWA1_44_29]KKT84016.1 MAG: Ribosomal RNA small subunit methyltransferase A [Candidatus Giovannonibacteria bacterium GW2011_GWC2_44_9]KKT91280.1 MAG: Ribosomal RNA small subunit methyltransferase A [Parcubacteria group bacterium GW2011_GWC1_45_13]KKU29803.1 MAG: Ribosomal RNA small subunit methyltransferase A [Candidatus Giovannonibacteria bacterium GW2011_GWB1_46_20]
MLNKQNKYLGQHFLKNKKILEEMARAAEISKKDIVLEVGPGTGTLTEILAPRAKKMIAIEKDRELVALLREKFRHYKNVEIVYGDILKFRTSDFEFQISQPFKIVSNLPYYITSRFLRLFLTQTEFRSKLMVLMVQKEVAERILARDGKESLLSLSVKAYAKAEIIRRVSKNLFSPPPKVDSAIIKISDISSNFFKQNKIDEKNFFEVLRAAFQKKRKMLRHSLKQFKIPQKYQNRRPEELSLEDWVKIVVK